MLHQQEISSLNPAISAVTSLLQLPGQVLQLPIFPLGHDRPHGAASIGSATYGLGHVRAGSRVQLGVGITHKGTWRDLDCCLDVPDEAC